MNKSDIRILKQDEGTLVTMEGCFVKKKVIGLINSGLQKISAEEAVDREIKALQLLEDVEGIQRFVRRESADTFYSKFIEGRSLFDYQSILSDSYFYELQSIVTKCHERGVYRIGQHRMDFLVAPESRPKIVDFGNVLFSDDLIARIPGVKELMRLYNNLRISDLRKRYTLGPEPEISFSQRPPQTL